MKKPFIVTLLTLLAVAQVSQVKAQQAIAGSGDLGSTTADGNTYWVAAQLALQHGENESAFTSSERACREGAAIACSVAGEMIVQGKTALGTPEQGVAMFQRGCELGNANACQGFGLMLVQGIGVTADTKKGQSAMQKACEANNAMACVNLGRMFEMGLFGSPNHEVANLYFNRALVLQPNLALNLQASNQSDLAARTKLPTNSQSKPPAATAGSVELRGRLVSNPRLEPTVAPDSVQATCKAHAAAQWNKLRDAPQTKPTWNTEGLGQASTQADAQTIGLALLAANVLDTKITENGDEIASCQSQFEPSLKRLLEQPWSLAPGALAPNTLVQIAPIMGTSTGTADGEQFLLLIVDLGVRSSRRPLHADKGFAFYRVNCDAAEVTPIFYFQTDGQGKLPLASVDGAATASAAISDRARKLGCATQSERRLWTQLSSLEAAMALRFEQDQQQTP